MLCDTVILRKTRYLRTPGREITDRDLVRDRAVLGNLQRGEDVIQPNYYTRRHPRHYIPVPESCNDSLTAKIGSSGKQTYTVRNTYAEPGTDYRIEMTSEIGRRN